MGVAAGSAGGRHARHFPAADHGGGAERLLGAGGIVSWCRRRTAPSGGTGRSWPRARGTPVLEDVRSLKGRFLLQNDGTLWEVAESPDGADDYELRRLAEYVSSVEWMYGWNCLLYTDRDGVLWIMEPDGSQKEIAERIWVPT